ncbi:hypothetical protein Q8F55_008759 [Vanrija albida]|uniref:RDD domain-containing protein n=1 Tax=Vanrija albida TaxID=181172 RepID=A0ABR3PS30_9TREE
MRSSLPSLRTLSSLLADVVTGVLLGTVASFTPVHTLRATWVAMRGIELLLLAFLVFKVWWLNDCTLLAVDSPVRKPDTSHTLLDDYVVGSVRDYDFGQLDHLHRVWIAHFLVGVGAHLGAGLVLLPLLASFFLFKHVATHAVVRAHLLAGGAAPRPFPRGAVPPNPRNPAPWFSALGVFESAPADAPPSGLAGFAPSHADGVDQAAMLALALEQVRAELAALGQRAAAAHTDAEGGGYVGSALADAERALAATAHALASGAGHAAPAARLAHALEVARAATAPAPGWLPLLGSRRQPRPELYLACVRRLAAAEYGGDEKTPLRAALRAPAPASGEDKATQAA